MILAKLQKLGKALMLPIAVLPIAGILLRIGQPDVLNMPFIASAGGAIFDNLPILFAIGVAVGLAKNDDGAAGLAGVVGYFILKNGADILTTKFSPAELQDKVTGIQGSLAGIKPDSNLSDVLGGIMKTATLAPKINLAILFGIIAGVTAGLLYNKFHDIKLPEFLGFFAGRRFVPIITGLVAIAEAFILSFIFPVFEKVFTSLGVWIVHSGAFGSFIFGVLNRLLIPTGLHHLLNSFVWFVFGSYTGQAGNSANGDLNRFFVNAKLGLPGDPASGQFMTGFFPVMMFGVLGACLAMYLTAKKSRRAEVGGLLISVALTSFLTGITEPFEFLFMFLSPVLYLLHALLTGLSMAVTYTLGMRDGFGFSAGLIDYVLNFKIATTPVGLALFGVVYFFIYFVVFYFMIKTFNLKTPGREDEDTYIAPTATNLGISEETGRYVDELGGIDNIKSIDSCITRLRLTVGDSSKISDERIMALGAKGVIRPSKDAIQIVLGQKAEKIADELRKMK